MPPQEPDIAVRIFIFILNIVLLVLLPTAYSLIAMWTLRRFGPAALAWCWVVTAATLGAVLFLYLGVLDARLADMRTLMALFPVSTTAGISILIWRLHKRNPEASALRCVAHGMAGFGLGAFAVFLAACAVDLANLP